jgi:hypothetical protein
MMENRFAIFISRSFNPLLITSLYLLILLQLQLQFTGVIPVKTRWMIMGLILITTYIVPALVMNLVTVLLSRNYKIDARSIRLFHLLIFAVFYLLAYHLLNRISLSPVFTLFVLGMASLSVIAMLILLVFDISLYTVATGTLAGAFIGLHLTLQINMILLVVIALAIGGLTGFSRLQTGRHSPAQVYLGYFTGLIVMLFHYLYL